MDSQNTWRDGETRSSPPPVPAGDPADLDAHIDEIDATSRTEVWTSTGPDNNPDLPGPGGHAEPASSGTATGSDGGAIQLAAVLDLFGRMKLIEDGDGGWNGGDTVDALCGWFSEFGIDVEADVITAAQELRVPSWLASFINSQTLDTLSLVIHLSSDNTRCTDLTRSQLTALVHTLGEGTTAAVYDNPGEQILRVDHADLDPVLF